MIPVLSLGLLGYLHRHVQRPTLPPNTQERAQEFLFLRGQSMRYIWESKKPRRVMHVMRYTSSGDMTNQAMCGIRHNFDRSINAPFGLGRRICKKCLRLLVKDE